jgi:hypothetical protein
MAADWFLNIADRIYGPYEAGNLRQFVQEGRLTPDTLIRKGEEGAWVAARQVTGLFAQVPGQAPTSVGRTPAPVAQAPTPTAPQSTSNAQDDVVPVEAVQAAVGATRSAQAGAGTIYCQQCGQPAHASQYQCANCGSPLRAPQTDNTLGGLIPAKNPKSLWAYYLGFLSLFACIPLIGIVIGLPAAVAAVVMGIKARRYAIDHPEAKGGIHALVGILMGVASLIVGILLQAMMVIGIVANMLDKR